jgi:hypothetical protein
MIFKAYGVITVDAPTDALRPEHAASLMVSGG